MLGPEFWRQREERRFQRFMKSPYFSALKLRCLLLSGALVLGCTLTWSLGQTFRGGPEVSPPGESNLEARA